MSDESNGGVPKSFYLTSGAALLWNIIGLGAYVSQVTMSPDALSALPDAERALYENMPVWATSAFAIAVTAGVLGCLLLLIRKSLALPILALSLVAALVQNFNSFVLMNALSVVGGMGALISIAVIVIGVYLVWLANDAKAKSWLS